MQLRMEQVRLIEAARASPQADPSVSVNADRGMSGHPDAVMYGASLLEESHSASSWGPTSSSASRSRQKQNKRPRAQRRAAGRSEGQRGEAESSGEASLGGVDGDKSSGESGMSDLEAMADKIPSEAKVSLSIREGKRTRGPKAGGVHREERPRASKSCAEAEGGDVVSVEVTSAHCTQVGPTLNAKVRDDSERTTNILPAEVRCEERTTLVAGLGAEQPTTFLSDLSAKFGRIVSGAKAAIHEDIDALLVSVGVTLALLVPVAMEIQCMVHDERVQERNFMLLLCNEPSFRAFVAATLDHAGYNFTNNFLRLDTRAVLLSNAKWPSGAGPEDLYECAGDSELAASAQLLVADFPKRQMNAWALMSPESALWSDHINAMASFAMSLLMAGLLGSQLLYISFHLGTIGKSESWNNIGFAFLGIDFLIAVSGCVVLLFAQDAYAESQDSFFLRDGRFGGYSKIALLAAFTPITVILCAGSAWSLARACPFHRRSGAKLCTE